MMISLFKVNHSTLHLQQQSLVPRLSVIASEAALYVEACMLKAYCS